jgi:acetoacetate decarboxylase
MAPFDPRGLTSTPYGAPLVPNLPIRLRRTEILTVVYRCQAEALERFIPEPLELADELCIAHVYWMHDAEWFGVYGESAFQIPVRLPDQTRAVYSPFLVLGSDGAVAAGRELYGQPKKQGEVELAPNGDLLVGRVARNGIDILTATICFKQAPAPADALESVVAGSALNVNLRVLPDGEGSFDRALLARRFEDVVVHGSWTGPATVELRPNAQVPVHLLPAGEVVLGLHRLVDLTLPPATAVHHYDKSP